MKIFKMITIAVILLLASTNVDASNSGNEFTVDTDVKIVMVNKPPNDLKHVDSSSIPMTFGDRKSDKKVE